MGEFLSIVLLAQNLERTLKLIFNITEHTCVQEHASHQREIRCVMLDIHTNSHSRRERTRINDDINRCAVHCVGHKILISYSTDCTFLPATRCVLVSNLRIERDDKSDDDFVLALAR